MEPDDEIEAAAKADPRPGLSSTFVEGWQVTDLELDAICETILAQLSIPLAA